MSRFFVAGAIISWIFCTDAILPADSVTDKLDTTTLLMEFGEAVTINSLFPDYETFCKRAHPAYCTTKISLDDENRTIARVQRLSSAIFTCPSLNFSDSSNNTGIISWFVFHTSEFIGYYDFDNNKGVTIYDRFGLYKIFNDSGLLVTEVTRKVVDRYICLHLNNTDELDEIIHNNVSVTLDPENIVLLRLDYSQWYSPVIFDSVFYGSVMASILLCGIVFIINIIWIIVQKIGLAIIRRREKRKGAQSFLQAMEAYRQNQIKTLQDSYHQKLHLVSEHYHRQVEQIREAYANQMTRIKDYGQTQYDSYVANRIENLREGYNAQLARIREFGSRHADQVFEGYERQLNRLRAFTLAQRMKLMRQYQLRQRDVNELLEKFPDTNVQEAVNREDPLKHVNTNLEFPEPRARIQKSVSCLSLPEFSLVDGQGEQILRQVTPSRKIVTRTDKLLNSVRPVSECETINIKGSNSNTSVHKSVSFDKVQSTPMENTPLLTTNDEVIVEMEICSTDKSRSDNLSNPNS